MEFFEMKRPASGALIMNHGWWKRVMEGYSSVQPVVDSLIGYFLVASV
jgi:hypothetical protein